MRDPRRWDGPWLAVCAAIVAAVYVHDALPYLTTLPRVNVDEPWLLERAYQVLKNGTPRQPMYGLDHAYLLQTGYGYLFAPWIRVFGLGMFQARLLTVLLGGGTLISVGLIASRLVGSGGGVAAALFLATDSNFLGGARDARTDIPAVFFASLALLLFLCGRPRRSWWWFLSSGVATGAAILCHANCYWVGIILFLWYLVDHGRRPLTAPAGWAYLGGLAIMLGPYVAILVRNWAEFQLQVNTFAADRVPGLSLPFVWQQVLREPERYRGWYFGLVTSLVPNPLLRSFQAAAVAGAVVIVSGLFRSSDPDRRRRFQLAGIVIFAPVVIFAGFIHNKALVYMPHLLIGFSIAAGAAVQAVAQIGRTSTRVSVLMTTFVVAYGAAGVAYYEKWYRSALKSEVVPYEQTAATLHTLIPPGPKLLVASPHFWVPFGADAEVQYVSYAYTQPDGVHLPGASSSRPTYVLIDETQFLPDLQPSATESTPAWRHAWLGYIMRRCAINAVALGTAYGTLALFRCEHDPDAGSRHARIVGGDRVLSEDGVVWRDAGDMRPWVDYVDPRRTAANPPPRIDRTTEGVRVSGGAWPGLERYIDVTPGERYLITYAVDGAGPQDLLYVGRWERPEVTSLAGASAAGFPAQLATPEWFPSMRGFVATSSRVRLLLYSEAPRTSFLVRSVTLTHLK